ncbi:MAG TPA: DUF4915 domain-containing protein [Acidimicrobiales bacterium]|nr:DUF4915 domain-containing protein [Acidimicrobiales bacterium]
MASSEAAGAGAGRWRSALGRARLVVSGFGKWGGGIYDLTGGTPEALDDLATSGLALGGGRLWRLLRAPGEQTACCELLSYDARGVRDYQRLDAIRDPHDVAWHDGAPHVSSSWDDAVWRVDRRADEPALVWQGSTVPDGWHVNSLTVVDGALHVCAFGRFDRHKGWKGDGVPTTGFVHDLTTGHDVLTGLAHPHTPRRLGGRWYVCESTRGTLTELDLDGTALRRAQVRRFTRGLAVVGPWALVGGNAHRDQDGDRAEIAVVDLRTFAVVERVPMPCLEVYDILPVPPAVVRGLTTGFGANAARAVEQHRSADRPRDRRPTGDDVAVRLVAPRTAAALAAMGEPLDATLAPRYEVRGLLPVTATAGAVTSVRVEVVNRSPVPLGSVVPRAVKVGARWFRVDGAGDGREGAVAGSDGSRDGTGGGRRDMLANPLVPLPRTLPPGMRVSLDVPLEAPGEPGCYELRVALRQAKLGWFGLRAQAQVEVVARPDDDRAPAPHATA